MKKDSNLVQIIVLVVFGAGIILGILFFSGKIKVPWDKKAQQGISGQVTVWGVLPYQQMKPIFDKLQLDNENLKLTYAEKKPETMQSELVNALSSGKGPDVFMMSPGEVAQNIDRLYIIPYANYPDTTFKATFADIGNDFLTPQGILALPLFIDPMVMYYNRDLLTSNFIVDPPTTWEKLAEMIPTLTRRDDAGKITQSAVALGTTNNISFPKDIVILKMLQAGSPIVKMLSIGIWQADLNTNNILTNALSWFITPSISSQTTYSWNQSLPKDREFFSAGSLAFYFGYPTELQTIRQKNPNLNFGITMVPQIEGSKKKVDYGRLYSVGVSKITKNLPGSVGVVTLLTNRETLSAIIGDSYYAPARRDMLSEKSRDNAEKALIYSAAIISKSFFDPDSRETLRLITTAINQINAGTKLPEVAIQAINSGFSELTSQLRLPEINP